MAQDSKVVTDVTVNATAVESMSPDSAVVLVAATSRVTNASGAKQEPRAWRLWVNLESRRRPGQDVESRVRAVTVTEKNAPDDEPTPEESTEAVEITESGESPRTPGRQPPMDADDKAPTATPRRRRTGRRVTRGARRNVGAILVAVLLIASAGLARRLYFFQYRPDQQTNTAAANVALEAAKSGTVALLSYSPDSLDKDFAAAKSNLTGDFLSYYTQFTEQIVTPAAKEKSVKTTASVVRAAVSEIQPDSAEVLVFINQTTTSKENPDGAFAASSVKVGLKKIDDRWLISLRPCVAWSFRALCRCRFRWRATRPRHSCRWRGKRRCPESCARCSARWRSPGG